MKSDRAKSTKDLFKPKLGKNSINILPCESDKNIKIKCPNCGHVNILKDLVAWSFIILRNTQCEECGKEIGNEEVIK